VRGQISMAPAETRTTTTQLISRLGSLFNSKAIERKKKQKTES